MDTDVRVDIPPDRPRVEVTLKDGTVALLSPLLPGDRAYLAEGLEEMSMESRFSRFGQGRQRLTGSELAYLSDIDQRRHVAWAAAVEGEGAGVGRYILFDDDECAEVAVTVLDRYQGRGLGTFLLMALVAVGRNDGVPAFCFEVLPTNSIVIEALGLLGAVFEEVDGLLHGRIPLLPGIEVPGEAELMVVMERVRSGG
jgi:GNAT superfamily N-acetyltransferase